MTAQFADIKKGLPSLGVGLGLRRELAQRTFENVDHIDWLEFVPENYMGLGGAARERLEKARSVFPLVSHGINLSIGTTDDIDREYIRSIKQLLDSVDSPWWSDHLCFTSQGGVYMHDLLPLPFSKEAVKHVAQRARMVQEMVGRPFLFENISFYMNMPGMEMTDAQFLSEVLEESDCGLLLDVNNIYVNSLNHKFDPYQYVDQIPLERTVQIHVAGHSQKQDVVIDTHGAPVVQPVFELLRYVLQKCEVKAVMIERDQNFPAISELIGELDQIRAIVRETQPQMLARTRRTHAGKDDRTPWIEEGRGKGREHASIVSA
jgi:hypothetical protein